MISEFLHTYFLIIAAATKRDFTEKNMFSVTTNPKRFVGLEIIGFKLLQYIEYLCVLIMWCPILTLSLPGKGPFPGVIDMFGMAGGLFEYKAALLASHGFAAMALAYFGYEDLPRAYIYELEYFEVKGKLKLYQYYKVLFKNIYNIISIK